jgi:hypothetical protein
VPVTLARRPLPKPDPQSDPRFRKITEQLKQGAAKTKAHPPASKKAADAAKAAKGPPNERLAGGKAKQVDKIKEAKEGKPEQSSFLAILRAEIAKAMPKTLGETENFDQTAQQMKGGLKGNVSQQKESSTKDVSGASKQAPAPAGEAKAEQPLPKEGAPPAPQVEAAEGMPAPKSDADVSLDDSKQNTDQQMKEAEVTTPQLQKANDPRFSAVLTAKDQVAQSAAAGPSKYRAAEKAAVGAAAVAAGADARKGAAAMIGVRGGAGARVLTRQQQQKAADEAKRKAVVDKIEAIYAGTKARVDAKLAALDPEVNGIFDSGVDAAINTMTSFLNAKILDYKLRRYLSIPVVGAARWIRDQFLGLPAEVNAFFEQGRTLFQGLMDALIVRVAGLVERRLKEAKAEVAKGQAEIKAFVASQPKELQQVAQQAQASVASRFAELESGIEEKKNSLAQSLAQKYKEGFDKANAALKSIQDENKGLVQAFAEKLGEIIKMLLEFKARLMGILRKGEETVKLIIADPVGFVGNLIAAVKGGIQAFVGNIWAHLKAGFMKWLFGNLPPGVSIPSDLSLVSIFKLVMGVLGITYDKMRAKAVKLIGNTAVTIIEKLVGYIYTLVTGGPAALWEQVKGDLSNLKGMVIDAIQSWLVETVVKQAVAKIVSMFNPAGAIIQAILAIYNVIMFVVEKAQQIMDFVEAVINSVHAIATGAIGGAISWIEAALARTIPIVIGFLARLIGLGGISQKIRDFILKVQTKVDQAIDKAIKVIVDKIKKLFGRGKDKKEEDPKVRWEKGMAAVEALAAKEKKKASTGGLAAGLVGIKGKFGFTQLRLIVSGGKAVIDAALNPAKKLPVDDTEFVTAEDGVTITIAVKPPAVTVALGVSNDGNTRLFGFDAKKFKIMVYVVSKKAWQAVPSDARVKEMEAQARQWLQSQNSGFVSLVNAEKDPSARGFDIAGLQPGAAGAPERMVIGEAKGSFQGSPLWFQAPKFTAIQGDPLAKNVAAVRRENATLVSRINSAIASGNVTIIVFLNKDARVSSKAWAKLERKVRKDLKAYILSTFPGSEADIAKIMKNVVVTPQQI